MTSFDDYSLAGGESDPGGQPEPGTQQVLQTDTAWNGKRYERYPQGIPVLSVVRYSIPPRSSLPWHTHTLPNTAYIISGSIILESADGDVHRFTAGEAFAESVNSVHRGYTEDEPAEIVCTYAGEKGIPLSVPAERSTPEEMH